MRQIVLGSSSPYRKTLLKKILSQFETFSPNIDESPLSGEAPDALIKRLALEKAKACAKQFPDALIVSSDQVSILGDQIRGKPDGFEGACQQLRESSGQTVTFLTSLCLYDARTREFDLATDIFHVHFRELSESEIQNYVEREQPFNCAGSFKSEGLGIALFRSLEGSDPNSLIGLPLIKLAEMLRLRSVKIL